jgi:alpha-ketoglutaric semialdehyde dehydrogenase
MTELVDTATARVGRNFIDGRWADTGATYEKRNPMRPSEIVAVISESSPSDVERAVGAATAAQPAWAALSMARRADFLMTAASALDARAEQIAQEITAEMGKPVRESRGEVARSAQVLRYFASEAFRPVGEHFEQTATGAQVSTRRRPLGVVGLITPWNFPCAIPAWKLAPALIYGNAVVLKAAYESPLGSLHLAECFEDAGLPPGVLNVILGRGSSVGPTLIRDPRVSAISFTGSVATGSFVRDEATKLGKRVQLELGGQNPLIVLADADLDRAVESAFTGAFWSAGQKCTATRRIYVEDAAYEIFRERFLGRISRARIGDPTDPEVEIGPLVNQSQFEDVLGAIERGRADGGTVLAGGERIGDEGYLIAPTVFEGVADASFLSCEEVFGPVVSIYRFASLDEAIARANAVELGLSASIFTSGLAAAEQFTREIEAGLIHVNSQTTGAEVHVPFGGIKGSGYGPHEQGRAAIEFYTELVTVYTDV